MAWRDLKAESIIPSVLRSTHLFHSSPVGQHVGLAGSASKVGSISHTYDPPISRVTPFPFGFRHDLSLIGGDALLTLTNQPNVPFIDGWASHREVLDSGPIFLCIMNVHTGDWRKIKGNSMSRAA